MYSWEIVCADVDSDGDYTDARAITELGYLAPTLRRKRADVVGAQIHQGHREFHVTVDGQRYQLEAVSDPELNFYVRTFEEDREDDPLLALPTCDSYEMDEEMQAAD